jgi:GTP-binding protein
VITILKSEFVYSVPKLSLMRDTGPEICFIGRSNVGKSSLINSVCQKKHLAKTSKLPGRTRHAVCYEVVLRSQQKKKSMTLVDMPGFGYASMSKTESKSCEALIFSYIEERPQLALLVLLIDMRRLPDEREEAIVNLAQKRAIPVLVVLTKADKIVMSKRVIFINKTASLLKIESKALLGHSTHDPESRMSLLKVMFQAL